MTLCQSRDKTGKASDGRGTPSGRRTIRATLCGRDVNAGWMGIGVATLVLVAVPMR